VQADLASRTGKDIFMIVFSCALKFHETVYSNGADFVWDEERIMNLTSWEVDDYCARLN
jgi:hypothetical protein